MLRWGLALIGTLLAIGTYEGLWKNDYDDLDIKINKMISEQVFWEGEADEEAVRQQKGTAEQKPESIRQTGDKEPSEMITFSETFQNISYGDVIGRIEVELTKMNCDIVYVQDRKDAIERSKKDKRSVYLYYTEDGNGLNASYIHFYADESIMPDYDEMKEIGVYSDERYLHIWMEVGTQQLQMDLLGAYYSDDMETDHGIMYVVYEPDFMPPDAADSDFAMLDYLKGCLDEIPDGYAYDKMVIIHNMKYSDNEHKRLLVAVNVSLDE